MISTDRHSAGLAMHPTHKKRCDECTALRAHSQGAYQTASPRPRPSQRWREVSSVTGGRFPG